MMIISHVFFPHERRGLDVNLNECLDEAPSPLDFSHPLLSSRDAIFSKRYLSFILITSFSPPLCSLVESETSQVDRCTEVRLLSFSLLHVSV